MLTGWQLLVRLAGLCQAEPVLELEPDAKVVHATCEHCGQPMTRVTGFVRRDGEAYAVFFASCYHHDGHEVWIDAVFSPTWADGVDDRYTFGCRVGPVAGQDEPAATLVPAAQGWGDKPLFGRKLSREEGLAHPGLAEFWALVDHVLVHDPVVRTHLYGPDARFQDG
jgi:hypothetical protein